MCATGRALTSSDFNLISLLPRPKHPKKHVGMRANLDSVSVLLPNTELKNFLGEVSLFLRSVSDIGNQ